MVGLVLVSHSRQLAEAACNLAREVSRAELPIDFAGGTGPNHAELGTDATDIMDAIARVYSPDGVIVLMDLGSAVISARLACQMLEDDMPRILLCPAPLVEGAVAAAVQIGAGASLEAVCAEARAGLAGKLRDLLDEDEEEFAPSPGTGGTGGADVAVGADAAVGAGDDAGVAAIPPDAMRYLFIMDEPNGMHARPAAAFVQAISRRAAQVRVRNFSTGSPFVAGASLNQLALSGIEQGDTVEVAVWGQEAEPVLEAIKTLVRDEYHSREATAASAPSARAAAAALSVSVANAAPALAAAPPVPLRLSPGIAQGRLYAAARLFPSLEPKPVAEAEAEVRRLDEAVALVHAAIAAQGKALGEENREQAAILGAQMLILDDAELLEAIRRDIRQKGLDAAGIYQRHMAELAARYRALPNEYLRERAADVDGVAEQMLALLTGTPLPDARQFGAVILWAEEVSPTQISRFEQGQLQGILTGSGGASSHVAIMAKAMNIPAISGYFPPEGTAFGADVVMDAGTLEVVLSPSPEQKAEFQRRAEAWREELSRDLADSRGQAVSLDGVHVPVLANVGDAASSRAALEHGAEGIGLLRTEFVYLNRRTPPGEEEQAALLAQVLAPFADKPVTVRTLDVGGDKSMPWLDLPVESNPFLGVRGIRLCMHEPELFATHLRAILRAGHGHDIALMVPMVSLPEEIAFARNALTRATAELDAAGLPHCAEPRFGIMIETPAAVLQAAELAAMVDFFSIGTNDLTQYVMAAERGSRNMPLLADGMHPAVLRAVALVTQGATAHGIPVAVCGEMAGEPLSAQALLGLGVDHLSMNPPSIGRIKRAVRACSLATLAELSQKALKQPDAAGTRRLFA